jgi:DNA-binding MarR family transcriptional regulator
MGISQLSATRSGPRPTNKKLVCEPSDDTVTAEQSEKLASIARLLIQSQLRRRRMLPGIEFDQPAWDMILYLYVASVEKRRVSVTSLRVAAGVPKTTALRWIRDLVEAGHFVRLKDCQDGRRCHFDLSPALRQTVEVLLSEYRRKIIDASR